MTKNQPEELARFRINNSLVALGWRLDAKNGQPANVRFGSDLKNSDDMKLLGRFRPDYVLYADDSVLPIGLIEAKKPGHKNMTGAMKQGLDYAKKLKTSNLVVFASDGNKTLCRHASGVIPTINGEGVYDFLSKEYTEKLANNPVLDLGAKIKAIPDLVRIFEDVSDNLRKDGIEAGMDSLKEFCLILFVKIMSERGEKRAMAGCKWERLTCERGDELLLAYQDIVGRYKKVYGDIFSDMHIKNSTTLEKIVTKIDRLNFSTSSLDVKGGAYEYFLSRYSAGNKSALGQYFTPRHITKMMAQLIELDKDDTIYDPFCGTGGMLVACYELMRNQIADNDTAGLAKLNNHTLYGGDISQSASKLAKMNMVILGDGHSNIKCVDSVADKISHKYKCVITNIPFNLRDFEISVAENYKTSITDANSLCIIHCLKSISRGGRAAIIAPETIAYQNARQPIRDFIKNNATIRAVIRLPKSVFTTYTSARTLILLLDDVWTSHTTAFPVVNLNNDGYSSAKNREPIPDNDIPDILDQCDEFSEHHPQTEATEDFLFFSRTDGRQSAALSAENSWKLGELIEVVVKKTPLDPDKTYYMPRLHSPTNTVSPQKNQRLGRNINGDKVLTKPGDLIIATLHTQDGLFAYCDQEYVSTSQIVARVDERLVSKGYLKYALRMVLPTLSNSDLVGRETYKPQEILELRIPKPTPKLAKAFRDAEQAADKIESELKTIINAEEESGLYFSD